MTEWIINHIQILTVYNGTYSEAYKDHTLQHHPGSYFKVRSISTLKACSSAIVSL